MRDDTLKRLFYGILLTRATVSPSFTVSYDESSVGQWRILDLLGGMHTNEEDMIWQERISYGYGQVF